MSNRLVIGPEGFVDMRRNPAPEKDQVNGWTPENGQPAPEPVSTVDVPPGPPATPRLTMPEPPVLVPVSEKPKGGLKRIQAVNLPDVYALVTAQQFHDYGGHEWSGTRSGFLYRREDEKVLWLHRICANCKRSDRFVAFRNGDQRDLRPNNLQVVKTKEKMHEIKRLALLAVARKPL